MPCHNWGHANAKARCPTACFKELSYPLLSLVWIQLEPLNIFDLSRTRICGTNSGMLSLCALHASSDHTLERDYSLRILFSLSRKKAFFCPWQLSDIHCTTAKQLFCFLLCVRHKNEIKGPVNCTVCNPELCSGQAVPQMLRLQNPTLWVFSPGVEVCSDHMGRYKRAAQSHSAKRYTRYDTPRPLSANALSLMTELAELGSDVSMNYLLGKQGTKLRQSQWLNSEARTLWEPFWPLLSNLSQSINPATLSRAYREPSRICKSFFRFHPPEPTFTSRTLTSPSNL